MAGSQRGASSSVNDGSGVGYTDWGHHSLESLIGNSYTFAISGGGVGAFSPFITPHLFLKPPTLLVCRQTVALIQRETRSAMWGRYKAFSI